MQINKTQMMVMAALFASASVQAQTAAPAAAPAAPDGALEFSGYVDASYNHLSRSNAFTSGTANRVFDLKENGVALQQIGLTAAMQPKQGFGGLVNVTLGRDADVINAYRLGFGKNNKFDVTQAFLQYATGPWTVIGGKYVTLAGAEVIKSSANPNFSRSILFGYHPIHAHRSSRHLRRGRYAESDRGREQRMG